MRRGVYICLSPNSSFLALRRYSDSESNYSASCSEEEEDDNCKEAGDVAVHQKTPARTQTASAPASKTTPAKKLKRDTSVSVDAVQLINYLAIQNASNNYFYLFILFVSFTSRLSPNIGA